jgi:polysaccharide deacetylase 2 family uncharacterized protein YibQ
VEESSKRRTSGSQKPPSAQKGRPHKSRRKKARKKVTLEDGVRAALITAAGIFAAALIAVVVIIIRSFAPVPEDAPSGIAGVDPSPAQERPAPNQPVSGRPVPEQPAPVLSGEKPAASNPERPIPKEAPPPPRIETSPLPKTEPPPVKPVPPPQTISPAGGRVESPPEPVPRRRGTLVFVIDDAGNNLRELEPFLRFPGPLTIAVLPGLPYSAEAARRIRAAGKEVFLHQPMEAIGGQDPGPGAVYAGMGPGEIRAIVERNIAELGPIAGMNNHQGSKITKDAEAMGTLLALCREYGIYFLDSRTTADTTAPAVAKRMGIKIGERDVFLDNIQEKAAMIRYVEEGLRKAERQGSAVMIGHTWSAELAATLEELYPDLIAQGFSLSTISRIMMDTGAKED